MHKHRLKELQLAARLGRIVPREPHASARMIERGATWNDVKHAILTASSIAREVRHAEERWTTQGGTDIDGIKLRAVVVFKSNQVELVTVLSEEHIP